MNRPDGSRLMVIIGWILVSVMAWQTGVSILEANYVRSITGITFLAIGFWALGVNREILRQKTRPSPDQAPEDAHTRRG